MTFGEKLIAGAKQAEEHSAGRKKLKTDRIEIAPVPVYRPEQIKELRAKLGLTQGLFGGVIGVSIKTVEAWEIGNRHPSSSALRIMAELDTNPRYLEKLVKIS